MGDNRIQLTQFYFNIVDAVAKRATCNRGRSGAILVKDGRIISTGYVGSAQGAYHCDTVGHMYTIEVYGGNCIKHCIRTVHAELNAILQAARYGPTTEGSVLYSTMFPCFACAQAIVNAGIIGVHSYYNYKRSIDSKLLFNSVNLPYSMQIEECKEYEEGK